MLDLGYSTSAASSGKIGEAGQGAKSGPLGIAKDVVIATAGSESFLVALLSASLHADLEAEPQKRSCVVPYLVCDRRTGEWEASPGSRGYFDKYTSFRGAEGLRVLRELCERQLPESGGGMLH
eukprot:1025955-Prymnesium_polylepis.1